MKTGFTQWFRSTVGTMLGKLRRKLRDFVSSFKTTEQIFTGIYRANRWGGEAGEICSGGGSSDEAIADQYIEMLWDDAKRYGFDEMTFVDLGCGDMRIGKRLIPLCKSYTGVDIVKYIVDRHQELMGTDRVTFRHIDIIEQELPDGDVCFLRQVLQHLSNEQIGRILPKLAKYRYVYITEHVPSNPHSGIPNIDKPPGGGIRLEKNSGVEITSAPFNITANEVSIVLQLPGNDTGEGADRGLIRTVLYTPGNIAGGV